MNKRFLILASFVGLLSGPASAQLSLNTTYNSGYNGNTALGAGAADTNFTIVSSPGNAFNGSPVVPNPFPSNWATTPHAQFISPTEDQASPPTIAGNPPGVYDFQTTLDTDFLTPTEIQVSGRYAADNYATVQVDGTTISALNPGTPTAPTSEFGFLTSFSYDLLVGAGTQVTTLDFVLSNYTVNNTTGTSPSTDNPAGLLVSHLKFSTNINNGCAPEPSTWAMMFLGLGVLVLVPRLRRVS